MFCTSQEIGWEDCLSDVTCNVKLNLTQLKMKNT